MGGLDYKTFLDLPCYFNLWSCILVILWLCYTTLLVQGASCPLYSSHNTHARPYYTWSIVLLFSLVLYLSVCITVRYIILSFQCTTYIASLFSHFHFMVLSFRVCTCWSCSDGPWFFQHQSLRKPASHYTKEPREITRRESEVPCFCVFWHFVLLWQLGVKLYLLYFCLVIFSVMYPDKS